MEVESGLVFRNAIIVAPHIKKSTCIQCALHVVTFVIILGWLQTGDDDYVGNKHSDIAAELMW